MFRESVRPEVRPLVDADPLDPQDATFGGDIDAGPIDDIDGLSGRSVDGLGGTGLRTPDGIPLAVNGCVCTGRQTREVLIDSVSSRHELDRFQTPLSMRYYCFPHTR